jgi:catechol 2,3-dioxygenase-like lactoylglutathione lyase family enzyme
LENQGRALKTLSEIVLRVRNLKAMQEFYGSILGLELFECLDNIVFFRIAPGFESPAQSLVLFGESEGSDHKTRHYTGLEIEKTTLHHFAFAISQSDFQTEYDRLQALGLDIETRVHEWVHYRSLYVCDPDGNVVELVCYDETVTSS